MGHGGAGRPGRLRQSPPKGWGAGCRWTGPLPFPRPSYALLRRPGLPAPPKGLDPAGATPGLTGGMKRRGEAAGQPATCMDSTSMSGTFTDEKESEYSFERPRMRLMSSNQLELKVILSTGFTRLPFS